MLDLYKLRLFVTVAHTQNLSKAAEAHYMSQSAMSQHIAQLEAYIGRALFTRKRQGVSLTPDGQQLYDYAIRILNLVAEAELALVNITADNAGELTIGATPNISTYRLPIWTSAFTRQYPYMRLRVMTDITAHIVTDVSMGKLDIGLIEGEIGTDHAQALHLHRLEAIAHVVVVGRGHPLWGTDTLSMSQLNTQKIIMRPLNSQSRQWLEAIFKTHQVRPAISLEIDNIESMKRMVENSDSIAILPDYTVADELKAGTLWAIRIGDVALLRDHTLLWNKSLPPTPIAHRFIRHLGALFGADIP